MSAVFAFHGGRNESGRSLVRTLAGGDGAELIRFDDLVGAGLMHDVESVRVSQSSAADNTLIVFDALPGGINLPYVGEHFFPPNVDRGALEFGDFRGNFYQVNNSRYQGAGGRSVNLPGDMRNRVSSALLLSTNRGREDRWSTQQVFPALWNLGWEAVKGASGNRILPKPVEISWLPFPRGTGYLHEDRWYLVVHQAFEVDWSPFYPSGIAKQMAAINAYIEFVVDPRSKPGRLSVVRRHSDFKVASGVAAGPVSAALSAFKPFWDGLFDVTLPIILGLFPVLVEDVYLLPGNQVGVPSGDVDTWGASYRDGATVVLVNAEQEQADPTERARSMLESFQSTLQDAKSLFESLAGGPIGPIVINHGHNAEITVMTEKAAGLRVAPPVQTPVYQHGWRWCRKCQGLFFGANPGSRCPADGGAHDGGGSGKYSLLHNSPGPAGRTWQEGWRWCRKCQGLFFSGNAGSRCPAGGAHSESGSGKYSLFDAGPVPAGEQGNWRWCRKCQGLFFGGNSGSRCPAGSTHSTDGSGNYSLAHQR